MRQLQVQAHPHAKTLVCLVYDPEGYCATPAALERDLTGVRDNLKAAVIMCPKGF